MNSERIGIIGAGVSGIGVAKALKREGLDFEICEATDRPGGNWQPSGAPASKMYRSAHLISSRRNTQFSDFPMPADYPHYPHHSLMYDYIGRLIDASGIGDSIRYNRRVTLARPEGRGWRVSFEGAPDALYDVLVVTTGLLGKPIVPVYPGRFDGDVGHAVNYLGHESSKDKNVLVVGGGNSGCDIAVDAVSSAARVFHSTRRGYHYMPKFLAGQPTQEWLMDQAQKFPDPKSYWEHVAATFKLAGFDGRDYGLPAPDHGIEAAHPILNSQILYHIGHGDIVAKPDVKLLSGEHVIFQDGSRERIDQIIWATGYAVDLPFFDKQFFDPVEDVRSAFLKVISPRFSNLLYVGFLNTPSGIGNVANVLGKFAAAYLKARSRQTEGWERLAALKSRGVAIDFGEARFVKTDRHAFEVDLWAFVKTMNFVTSQLQS